MNTKPTNAKNLFQELDNFSYKERYIVESWRKAIEFEKLVCFFEKVNYKNSKMMADAIAKDDYNIANFDANQILFFDTFINACCTAESFLKFLKELLGGVRSDNLPANIFSEASECIAQMFININTRQCEHTPLISSDFHSRETSEILKMFSIIFSLLYELSGTKITIFKRMVEVSALYIPEKFEYKYYIDKYHIVLFKAANDAKLEYMVYHISEDGKQESQDINIDTLIQLAKLRDKDYLEIATSLNPEISLKSQ